MAATAVVAGRRARAAGNKIRRRVAFFTGFGGGIPSGGGPARRTGPQAGRPARLMGMMASGLFWLERFNGLWAGTGRFAYFPALEHRRRRQRARRSRDAAARARCLRIPDRRWAAGRAGLL
jgi:hypothetical protein